MKRLIGAAVLLLAALAAGQVAVTLAPSPRLQFFDANGSPCSGCLLYSYAAGSATPLATYLDSTGTTQNANPVVLDSMGSASVWLKGAAYKLVLTTSGGSQLFNVDNIEPSDTTYLRLDGTNGPVTGALTFSSPVTLSGGGTLAGTIAGAPTFSGNAIFSGQATFSSADGILFARLVSKTVGAATLGSIGLAHLDKLCWENILNTGQNCIAEDANGVSGNITVPSLGSQAASPAISGFIAMASGDSINWMNAAGSANIGLSHNSSDDLLYNGNVIATPTGSATLRYSATVPVLVTNSTATTTLESVTYGAGDINSVGRSIHVFGSVYVENATGVNQTAVVQLNLGSSVIASCNCSFTAADSGGILNIDAWFTITATGASGTAEWAASYLNGAANQINFTSASSGTLTLNTTSSQAISVTVALSAASTSLTAKQSVMVAVIQ